ncbi:MAG: CARDB domain-containing protein [Candidatus Thermoplasmatota archaeon]|nr:CARDB domain-containing protein [Candidatus Thermoplasmatota archaeon]
MADGPDRNFIAIFGALLTLMLVCAIPMVSATSPGVTIVEDSINTIDFQTFEEDFFELAFNLSSANQGNSDTNSGQVFVETSLIDGTILTNNSIPFELEEGNVEVITTNLTNMNFGYTIIEVSLVGDVGEVSDNHISGFQRTVQRLKPLNVSIGLESSVIIEPVDSNGILTGNNSISDGDYIQLQIPIINDGDYSWTGEVNLTLENGLTTEALTSEILTISGMETEVIYFNSTIQVYEGTLSVSVELNETLDSYIEDNSLYFSISINPPPLPLIDTQILYNDTSLSSGDDMPIIVEVYNNGSVAFSGILSCLFEENEIYNSSIQITALTSITENTAITLRPGELTCSVTGQRIDNSSTDSVLVSFSLESALFEYAGASSPSSNDGPWHVGDDSTFSLLVRNVGTKPGNVGLFMESLGVEYQGELITLGPSQAGEISLTVQLTQTGSQYFNWSVYTTDGDVSGITFGQVSIPVANQQTYEMSLYDVAWSVDDGVTAKWDVNLSSGNNREMNIKIGYGSGSEYTIIYDVDMVLGQGSTSGEITLGDVDAEYIIIQTQGINWTAQSSFSSFTKSIPQDRPNYVLTFNSLSTPNRPIAGESASVSVVLENQGQATGPAGKLILFDTNNFKLAESDTNALSADSSQTVSFDFNWPRGEEVKLTCKWDYDDLSQQIDRTFLSTATSQESSESVSIPWTGLLGGSAISAVIILIVRMRGKSDKSAVKKKSTKTSKKQQTELSDVKIEVGCPECSRQLRVPENYEGTVRCPDCTHSFAVGPVIDNDDEPHDDSEPNDGKIEISCPECSQSLRIPESYDGSVRCPSCKAVFSAKDG